MIFHLFLCVELEKVFVTTSEIWSIPMPHYSPRFIFIFSNSEHNTEEHPSLFKNDDEADDVG